MKNTAPPLLEIYQTLFKQWGEQHWWPGDTRLEICIGAILTQNTNWLNVEKAIARLKANQAVDIETLYSTAADILAGWIRPAGYYNVKARRIKAFITCVVQDYDGNLDNLLDMKTATRRHSLLNIHGIGPETADSISLYAGGHPVFVVDAYTRRILFRHGWISENASYLDIAKLFRDNLPANTQIYNEYHALIVKLGKEHCHTTPKCLNCPLNKWLLEDNTGL